jgi:predicted transcriptional regulator
MKPYGLVDRNIILNKNLSLEAKGIYGILMNLDGTDFELDEICECVSEGKEVVEKALNELVNHGFISFEK